MLAFRSQIKKNAFKAKYLSYSSVLRSTYQHQRRKTLLDIQGLYESKTPISMVTAYDYITGKYAEGADIDINLVGDSLAMAALGYEDTTEITLDEFLYHTKAVYRGNKSSFIMADVPFGYAEISPEQAASAAIRLVKEGKVQGIKIEGGREMAPTIKKLASIGIPVMGHVGLTPQRHNSLGGFKLQGNTTEKAMDIYKDCKALQDAGVFAILLECVPNKLAQYITDNLSVPTIGIGAGPHCSGHVLVMSDLLGMANPRDSMQPKFVKKYSDAYNTSVSSLNAFKKDLISKKYPNADDHGFKIKREVFENFKKQVETLNIKN